MKNSSFEKFSSSKRQEADIGVLPIFESEDQSAEKFEEIFSEKRKSHPSRAEYNREKQKNIDRTIAKEVVHGPSWPGQVFLHSDPDFVRKHIDTFAIDPEHYYHASDGFKIGLERHPEIMRELLATTTFDVDNPHHMRLLYDLTLFGGAEIVAEKLSEQKFTFQEIEFAPRQEELLRELIANGQADFVKEKIANLKIDWKNQLHIDLMRELTKAGEYDFVEERVRGVPVDFDNLDFIQIYALSVERSTKIDHEHFASLTKNDLATLSIEHLQHVWALRAFAKKGGASAVAAYLSDHVADIKLSGTTGHAELLSVVAFHGEYESIAKILDEKIGEEVDPKLVRYRTLRFFLLHEDVERVKKHSREKNFNLDVDDCQMLMIDLFDAEESQLAMEKLKNSNANLERVRHIQLFGEIAHNGHLKDIAAFCNMSSESFDSDGEEMNVQFDAREIAMTENSLGVDRDEELEKLKRAYVEDGKVNIDGDIEEKRDTTIRKNLENMTDAELYFFCLAMEQHTRFSKRLAKFLDYANMNTDKFLVEISKTGENSRLFVYGKRDRDQGRSEITFVNDIPEKSAGVWQETFECGKVPVAPIIAQPKKMTDGTERVYSRYCGKSLAMLYPHMSKAFQKELLAQYLRLMHELHEEGVDHGHPHPGNVTIEFIDKEYLRAHLRDGGTVNDIPYNEDDIHFDVVRFMQNPGEFKVMMRLIDFDVARYNKGDMEHQ